METEKEFGVVVKAAMHPVERGCEINCVNGHRFVNLLLKGNYYGQTDTTGKTETGTY